MCGVFGWQLKPDHPFKHDQLAAMAAVLCVENDRRGGDAWGFFDEELRVKKGLGNIVASQTANKFARRPMMAAHTRYGTTGSNTVNNAHPFEIGNLIGMHNGVVTNHHELNKTYGRKCTVDSQHIFHHLDSGLPTEEIEAYGTIVWACKDQPGRVNLCRFNGGELSIAFIGSRKNRQGVVWSSAWEALYKAEKASGIPLTHYQVDQNRLYFVEGGELFVREKKYNLSFSTPVYAYSGYSSSRSTTVKSSSHATSREQRKAWEDDSYSNWWGEQSWVHYGQHENCQECAFSRHVEDTKQGTLTTAGR